MKKLFFILCLILPFLGFGAESRELELAAAKKAALLAGQRVMHFFVHGKDKPVLTDATSLAHREAGSIIQKQLKDSFSSYNNGEKADSAWLFDPLEGLGEFDKRGSRFCITIGLVNKGVPVLGVYYFPATETFYWATKGSGAFKQVGSGPVEKIEIRPQESSLALFTNQKSLPAIRKLFPVLFGRVFTADEENKLFSTIGSLGFRICQIAEGVPNLYIAEGYYGKLWNFVAGQVILQEVGGYISDLKGRPIDYRDEHERIHDGVVICNNASLQGKVLARIAFP